MAKPIQHLAEEVLMETEFAKTSADLESLR